jgi:hypothetical protein
VAHRSQKINTENVAHMIQRNKMWHTWYKKSNVAHMVQKIKCGTHDTNKSNVAHRSQKKHRKAYMIKNKMWHT